MLRRMPRRAVLPCYSTTLTSSHCFAATSEAHSSPDKKYKLFPSIRNKLDQFTNFSRNSASAANAHGGPQYGIGYDPVNNHVLFTAQTGPLRRKASTNVVTRPEECFSPEEERRWMEVKQAGKVLRLKESDLDTLTRETLETQWVKLYQETTSMPAREEVVIATEVLLEYLDSVTFTKKNRLYYHKIMENARLEVDQRLQRLRNDQQQLFMKLCGAAALGACVVIFLVGLAKGVVNGAAVWKIGTNASDYLTMGFLQAKNFEPPPDYSTRYLLTPSAVELDRKAQKELQEDVSSYSAATAVGAEEGGKALSHADLRWDSSSTIALRQAQKEADRNDAVELLQLYNEGSVEKKATQEETEGAAANTASPSMAEETRTVAGKERDLKTFMSTVANQFGGGSRLQRMSASANESIQMREEVKMRLERGKEVSSP